MMDVTVLGCGAAFPFAGGACSGYLLEGEGATVWVDAGNGTLSRLMERVPFREVDAIVLSHRHADHIADLVPFMYGIGYDEVFTGRVPVYAPPDVAGVLRGSAHLSEDVFDQVFEFRRLKDPFEVGALRFEPFETRHPVETYGVRVSEAGRSFVYTADTADFPELPDHCEGADLLVCEATFQRPNEAPPGIHLWADEAGTVATKAGAHRVLLTHRWGDDDASVTVEQARSTFDGPLDFAEERRTYRV